MQEEVRNVVLSYLRANEVSFVWRDGFVEIPDARKISRLASGRRSLSLTFDRDAAALLPNVDYVTFGHPLLDQILEDLRGQAAYVERYFGTDIAGLIGNGVPHVTWQELDPGSVTPRVSRPDVHHEQLLLVRIQVDLESDFRHVETFGTVVDLESGRVVPERAGLAQRSSRSIPGDFSPADPAVPFEQAIAVACDQARAFVQDLVEVKRVEAEERLRGELKTAGQGGLSQGQLEHLERELARKYNVSAKLRVVGVERWFVQSEVRFSVRVPEWGERVGFTITYDVEKQETHVDLTKGRGTTKQATHVRLCAARHGDTSSAALAQCSECQQRFCERHVSRCDVTQAPCCDAELERCADEHEGRVLKRLLRRVDGRELCRQHIGTCAECEEDRWTARLETCANSGEPVCLSCKVACQECSVALAPAAAVICARSRGPLCTAHAVRCVEPGCGLVVRSSSAVTLTEDGVPFIFCREHVGACADGHQALSRALKKCSVSGGMHCAKHIGDCSCGRLVARRLLQRSAASGKSVCQSCRVCCAECKRPFLESETSPCGLTGASTCAEDLHRCAEPDCRKSARPSSLVSFEGQLYCPAHMTTCSLEHPTLKRRMTTCAISRVSLCDRHTDTCSCGRIVSRELIVPSAASGRNTCSACAITCHECNRFFLGNETDVCQLTGERVCRSDLVACSHEGCDRRAAGSHLLRFKGRQVCPDHCVACPDGQQHGTLKDLVRPCTAHDEGAPCAQLVCDEASHRCAGCGQAACQGHKRRVVGKAGHLCPTCHAREPRCAACGLPSPASSCPLCRKIASEPFKVGHQLPLFLEQACAASGVPLDGAWRTTSDGDAQLWERRVGLRIERFGAIGEDPTIYRGGAGAARALWTIFRGS